MSKCFKNHRPFRPSVAKRGKYDEIVQNGLAITPSQMMDLTSQGLAIGAQNQRILDTVKASDADFFVPMEFQRHIDMADMWCESQNLRAKIKKAKQDATDGVIESYPPTEERS